MPSDTIACIFWLKNRQREIWGGGGKRDEKPKAPGHDPVLQELLKGLLDDEPQRTANEVPSRTKPSGRNGGDQR